MHISVCGPSDVPETRALLLSPTGTSANCAVHRVHVLHPHPVDAGVDVHSNFMCVCILTLSILFQVIVIFAFVLTRSQ